MWAARELEQEDPFGLVPEDWGWWLRNFRGHDDAIGWPATGAPAEAADYGAVGGFKQTQ